MIKGYGAKSRKFASIQRIMANRCGPPSGAQRRWVSHMDKDRNCLFSFVKSELSTTFITGSFLWVQFSSVQLLSRVWLFVTPRTVGMPGFPSLSVTNFWSLLKVMSIESVMPSNHFILCHPLEGFPKEASYRSFLKALNGPGAVLVWSFMVESIHIYCCFFFKEGNESLGMKPWY